MSSTCSAPKRLRPHQGQRRRCSPAAQAGRRRSTRRSRGPGSSSAGPMPARSVSVPTRPRRAVRRARQPSAQCALDPSDAEAHAAMGDVFGQAGDFVRARGRVRGVASSQSRFGGDTNVLCWLGKRVRQTGTRAQRRPDRAIRLNPHFLSWQTKQFSYAYFNAGRYEDSLRMMERASRQTSGTAAFWCAEPRCSADSDGWTRRKPRSPRR